MVEHREGNLGGNKSREGQGRLIERAKFRRSEVKFVCNTGSQYGMDCDISWQLVVTFVVNDTPLRSHEVPTLDGTLEMSILVRQYGLEIRSNSFKIRHCGPLWRWTEKRFHSAKGYYGVATLLVRCSATKHNVPGPDNVIIRHTFWYACIIFYIASRYTLCSKFDPASMLYLGKAKRTKMNSSAGKWHSQEFQDTLSRRLYYCLSSGQSLRLSETANII